MVKKKKQSCLEEIIANRPAKLEGFQWLGVGGGERGGMESIVVFFFF